MAGVVAKAKKEPWWRVWLVEPVLWIGFFVATIGLGMLGFEELVNHATPALGAGFAYSVLMPAFLLSPGRFQRGYSPFGPVVRRVWPRLVGVHLLFLPAIMTIVGLHLSTSAWLAGFRGFMERHGAVEGFFLIGLPLGLVIWQGVLSSDLLDETRDEMLKAGEAVSGWG